MKTEADEIQRLLKLIEEAARLNAVLKNQEAYELLWSEIAKYDICDSEYILRTK